MGAAAAGVPFAFDALAPVVAGTGAAATGASAAAPSLAAGLYGMLPGLGAEQAAMLAAQTGEFGLSGLAATGNAAASAAGGPGSQALWGAASQLTGPLGAKLGAAGKGLSAANSAMQMAQGGQQGQQVRAPPMPTGGGMSRQAVPSPMQIVMWRRAQRRQQGRV